MDFPTELLVPGFRGQYLMDGPGYEYQHLRAFYLLVQCTLVFITAVNDLEFCKTFKSKLGQDRDTTVDI